MCAVARRGGLARAGSSLVHTFSKWEDSKQANCDSGRSYRFREVAVRGEAVEVEARNGWRNQRITITLTFTPDSLEGNATD